MKEFRSFLSPQIHSFIRYRQASQRWNDSSYEENLMLFDHYCHANDPCATALTQEMVDGWCRQRRTETNNSCRSRIYVVDSFIRFLNMRGLSNVQPPQIPRKERRRYLPQKHLLLQKMRTISITRKNKIPETLVNKGLLGFCSCPFAHPLCIFLANSLVKTSLSGPSEILHYFYFFLSAFFSRRCIQHQVLFRHTFDKILL